VITLYQASAYFKVLQNDPQIGKSLVSLLDKSRRLGERILSVRRTLRRHARSIQMPAAGLTIRSFGRAEVGVNGRNVAMSDWKTKSVRDLFFYFLYMQDAVTKEQVGEKLWPEIKDPQALKARFKDEIYRLRRAVGKNAIVFDEEVYYRFNRTLDYEYDVEAFESYITRARKTKDVTKRIEYYQKAMDLVHGPYLSENRFNEVVYQLEMLVYAALGDRASIARQYQACKIALGEGLGLLPSPETENLYRELTV
jgi:two-component SAPR family response regulator